MQQSDKSLVPVNSAALIQCTSGYEANRITYCGSQNCADGLCYGQLKFRLQN